MNKYKNCVYILLTNTLTESDKRVRVAAVPALSPLTFQSVHSFTKTLLSPETLEIFFRKPDRVLIIHVLEDTGTIPILFPWLLTHVIIMYIFYHSIIMTYQRKDVISQTGKLLIKNSST